MQGRNIVDERGLLFLTAVNFTKKELQELNSMTFIYDPNWKAGVGNRPTLPLCLFHVKSQTEVMESDVSQKQMLFYNSTKGVSSNAATGGQTAVVADNIVIKPKTYRMEVIVPYSAWGLSMLSGSLNQYQVNGVNSFLADMNPDNGNPNNAIENVSAILQQTFRTADIIKDLIEILFGTSLKERGFKGALKDIGMNFTSTPDYNKESLEAMWRNRSILKMKVWNSWQYKYVVIKNVELNKEGTSEGVYEGSITVQEIPILTVRPTAGMKITGWKSPIISLAGEQLKRIIDGKEAKEDIK